MKRYWPKAKRMLKELLALPFVADIRTCLRFYAAVITSTPQILRDKNFSTPHSKMWGKPCTFRFLDKKIQLDGVSFGYAGEIYVRKCYTQIFSVEEGDTVVDLGASVGVFSIAAALVGKKVLAVDIEPRSLEVLEKHARLNSCLDKIDVVLGAVGPGSGMSAEQMKKVPALDFGRLLLERGIEKVDFLKVDIEGSEFDLFRHSKSWLGKIRKIAMEVHPECGDVNEIRTMLEAAGFGCVLKDLDGRSVERIPGDAGYLFAARTLRQGA